MKEFLSGRVKEWKRQEHLTKVWRPHLDTGAENRRTVSEMGSPTQNK